jgi:hypothetical protein
MPERIGISNRESANAESKERQEHPTINATSSADAPEAEDTQAPAATENEQTSRKAGTRSTAQKETESRYPDRTMPASSKVAGAFGKEDR